MSLAVASTQKTLAWLASILVPIAVLLLGVRLIMTPTFLQLEYRTPNFPPDSYGFSLADRLVWSRVALDILVKQEDISTVEALRFEDGTPVFNSRELRHWEDAITLWRRASRLGYTSWVLLVGLGLWAWRGGWWPVYRFAIGRGGLLTALLMGALLLFAILAFGVIFVGFHELFFPPGTWTFAYSDTFIRLFPERFWRDTFLVIGIFSGGIGLSLWYFLLRRS